MIDIEQFAATLKKAAEENKTGQLRVGARRDGKLEFASLFFAGGVLHGCEFAGRSGAPAFEVLLATPIVSSVFLQDAGADAAAATPIAGVGAMLAVAQAAASEPESTAIGGEELFDVTLDAMAEIFGRRAPKLVGEIAAEHPPGESAARFLQECSVLAANLVGRKKAGQIFDPLFELV